MSVRVPRVPRTLQDKPGYLGGLPGGGSQAGPGRLTPAVAAAAGAGPPRALSGEVRGRGLLRIGGWAMIDSRLAPPPPLVCLGYPAGRSCDGQVRVSLAQWPSRIRSLREVSKMNISLQAF